MSVRCIALPVLAAMAWLTLVASAFAHASLTGTEPIDRAVLAQAPSVYRLSFSEPVTPLILQLVRPDGTASILTDHRVRDRVLEIRPPGELANGTHVLTWRVASADGHPVGGSLIFSIGEPSASPPPVAGPHDGRVRAGVWVTRVALYAGVFAGIGGALAIASLLPRSRSGIAFVASALGVGFAGTALSPGFQGLDALGASLPRYFDPLIWSAGLSTSYGRTVLAMLVALLLGGLSLMSRWPALSRILSLAALAGGAGALALSGHASAAAPQWLTRPSVFLHAATAAIWAGALIPLVQALRSDAVDAAAALRRFSFFIPLALAILIAAGGALAIIQLETPAAIFQTAYGRLFAAKLALLTILLALAGFNRWKLTARATQNDAAARRMLVRSIAGETLAVLLILGVAAGWRFTPPPRALAIAAAQPAEMHVHALQAMADVTVSPGRAGPVAVSAIIMSGDFGPLDAGTVTFVFSNPAAGVAPFAHEAEKPGDGTWRADDVVLPLPGRWTLRIDIAITDFEIASIEGKIEIRP